MEAYQKGTGANWKELLMAKARTTWTKINNGNTDL